MLSNYQFDKYLSAKKNEDGEEQLRLPLEQILLDAGADFEKVGALCYGRLLTSSRSDNTEYIAACGVNSK